MLSPTGTSTRSAAIASGARTAATRRKAAPASASTSTAISATAGVAWGRVSSLAGRPTRGPGPSPSPRPGLLGTSSRRAPPTSRFDDLYFHAVLLSSSFLSFTPWLIPQPIIISGTLVTAPVIVIIRSLPFICSFHLLLSFAPFICSFHLLLSFDPSFANSLVFEAISQYFTILTSQSSPVLSSNVPVLQFLSTYPSPSLQSTGELKR
jgi:hypothetical protein